MKINKVYLVGAGPSRALITVRGLEILRQADVVIYDYLVDKSLLNEAREGAQLICCDLLGKKCHLDGFLYSQDKINALMVSKAKEGKRVIRLKNGDPSLFSRVSQELSSLLENKIRFEVVPGVTSASSAACFSGIPLTDRRFSSSVVLVTGHEDPSKDESSIDWKSISGCGTIVLYMAVENISRIASELIKEGKPEDTPVMAVSYAGCPNQKTIKAKLSDIRLVIKKERILPPAIFIIGKVVDFEKKFNWLKKSRRILFTGLSNERFFMEETYFHLPLIKIMPISDYAGFDNYLKGIGGYDWIIFTSRYGAEFFFRRLNTISLDSRDLKDIKIAAIGNSTKKRLEDFGILADLVPENESSRGLLNKFSKMDIRGRKIFLPRSDLSDKGLTEGLKALGAKVTAGVCYRNVASKSLPDLDLSSFDEIMFTSPSGVRNFVKRYGNKIPGETKISCIGEVTLKEARKFRLLR